MLNAVKPAYNEHIGKWESVHYICFSLYLNMKYCVQIVTGNKDLFFIAGILLKLGLL